jgi:hypothetical protein
MELRRKQEEAERLRLEEEDRKAALMLQAQLEKEVQEDNQYRQMMEQERRDHELALRLAQESNGQIDESPTMSRKYVKIEFLIAFNLYKHKFVSYMRSYLNICKNVILETLFFKTSKIILSFSVELPIWP